MPDQSRDSDGGEDSSVGGGHWLDYVWKLGLALAAILFGLYLHWYAYTDPSVDNGSTELSLLIFVLALVSLWAKKEAKKHYPRR